MQTIQNSDLDRGVAITTLILISTIAFIFGLILAQTRTDIVVPSEGSEQSSPTQLENDNLADYDSALAIIYEDTVPSVVKIVDTRRDPNSKTDFGSGFIWDRAGHILTNFHVVMRMEQPAVIFVDGTRLEAEILGSNPLVDLAVLKVNQLPDKFQPLTIGHSTDLKVGHLTLAIGMPFGHDFTMTRGIVSAVGRSIRSCESCVPVQAIQTDTPINPGNSGGPLLNQRGEVIGINTKVVSHNDANTGISFAISIDVAQEFVPYIIDREVD